MALDDPKQFSRLVDLVQVRTFVTVAHESNLTRAAERLAISQPTASGHIRALEEQLRLSLFNRTSRGLELTSSGKIILERAERVLEFSLALVATAGELRDGVSGPVYIGSNADPALGRVGEFVGKLRAQFPLIEPHVQLQSAGATRQSVRNGELDVGFFLGAKADDQLVYHSLARVRYRVVGPRSWHDSIMTSGRNDLAKMPWIVTAPGNAHSDMMREIFLDHGLEPRCIAEANNDLLIRSLILEGIGMSLIREDYALEAEARGTMSVAPSIVADTDLMFAYARIRHGERFVRAAIATVGSMWALPIVAA